MTTSFYDEENTTSEAQNGRILSRLAFILIPNSGVSQVVPEVLPLVENTHKSVHGEITNFAT